MPRLTVPEYLPTKMGAAIDIFGSKARSGILFFLIENEPAYAADIASALGASKISTWKHLNAMEEEGVIVSDTPQGQRRGRPPRYSRNPAKILDLLSAVADLARQDRPDER
ncbi:winged helix-turn-helix domain-containing protein [Arthrobacter bambusae]|uniref:Transcriptional regulator n=1 Tax=Arthrobacter bambusae TaxID=1338426 RepID=A0AAW8DDX5_9MICC|nr:winged helix-turn-helix domain-containing protein [Arthrobacter bambusae]MDP9904708.1 putative transcriptional regulator [Arthrobacter bambusae]MDQ0129524.1 putative transcriptional regulator [Arthrobacter bambusae]MDQ0180863.1 putative transcriptional regulator [Arthrobacter bambusae]